MVPSREALTRSDPFGEKATDDTQSEWGIE